MTLNTGILKKENSNLLKNFSQNNLARFLFLDPFTDSCFMFDYP